MGLYLCPDLYAVNRNLPPPLKSILCPRLVDITPPFLLPRKVLVDKRMGLKWFLDLI